MYGKSTVSPTSRGANAISSRPAHTRHAGADCPTLRITQSGAVRPARVIAVASQASSLSSP